MILSNVAIVDALFGDHFAISGLSQRSDATAPPFSTSAVDLTLGAELKLPRDDASLAIDFAAGNITHALESVSRTVHVDDDQPFVLQRNRFVLGITREQVDFRPRPEKPCYAARVEGKSSRARVGVLIHFTAPTIHAGFHGTIALEIINLGFAPVVLRPGMSICQLIIEEVKGNPLDTASLFRGQQGATGQQ